MKSKKRQSLTDKKIINLLKENSDILKKYRVKKMGLFGSYVKGEQKKNSDIDFLVEFESTAFDANFTGYFDNYVELQSSLKRILKRNIDLLTNEMISSYVRPHILKEVKYV